jgi:hypothetical protein
MSNQDEPVYGPTGDYRKESQKKTIRNSKEDTSEYTSNESTAYYGVGDAG